MIKTTSCINQETSDYSINSVRRILQLLFKILFLILSARKYEFQIDYDYT